MPSALGLQACISGKSLLSMLQLILIGCKKMRGQEEPATNALISTKAKKSVNKSAT